MMLLPSLIRTATGQKQLGYQIVQGLASIAPTQLKTTSYSAARVAYLVDGESNCQDLWIGVSRDVLLGF